MTTTQSPPRRSAPTPGPHDRGHQRRFAQRTWRHRLRRARPWLLTLLLAAAGGGIAWLFFFSTTFAANSVEVAGSTRVDDLTIRNAAQVPLGGPLARVDLDSIEERVADLPPLADVRVSRAWPHAVRITVTDRVPVAALATSGRWRLVDADGFVWGRSASAPRDLPKVRAGKGVRREAVREAARVVTALPRGLAAEVAEIEVRTIDQITLQLADGLTVRWGSAERSALKAEVLAAMVSSDEALVIGEGEDAQPAGVVDVSVPTQPTVSR